MIFFFCTINKYLHDLSMSSLKDFFGGVLKTNPHFSATVNNKPTIFKLLQCNYALKLLTLNSCLQNISI